MKILFVCLGNICRSPTAEAVLRHLASVQSLAGLEIDSAGTGNYHVGHAPDPRTITAARRRGLDMRGLRARQIERADFLNFDLILAMDRQNLIDCERLAPTPRRARLQLFLEFAPHASFSNQYADIGTSNCLTRLLDALRTKYSNIVHSGSIDK